ncbi:hypothetical protein [Deinococcus sp. Marseille-Q6407]|uniref:hypothetical protein n=1 Tax=Deinococcus sp. Marseille-Q6407 TaxID=2969223 RepID=UPI0021BFF6A6|nr:hypothetical protein [Deinococcus sp. Marseille-Q6407]
MKNLLPLLLMAATLGGAAFAQSSVSAPLPTPQKTVAQVPAGLSAHASAPRYTSGPVRLTLSIANASDQSQTLSAPRDNRQECVAAPLVRVLEAGSRSVVYPPARSGNATMCAQDMLIKEVPAGGSLHLERSLDLPAGDYLIESWFSGNAADGNVKLPAEPVRVTVW